MSLVGNELIGFNRLAYPLSKDEFIYPTSIFGICLDVVKQVKDSEVVIMMDIFSFICSRKNYLIRILRPEWYGIYDFEYQNATPPVKLTLTIKIRNSKIVI